MIKRIISICIAALFMISCGSSKQIAYLQDVAAYENSQVNAYTNVIKPGDLLSIVVSSSKSELAVPFNLYSVKGQLSTVTERSSARQELEGYTVNPEGYIDFPMLGAIRVAGMTRNELMEMLKGMLMQYMPDPIVTINFLNFNITVIGEVNKQGNYPITGDRVTIFQALGMAGDLSQYGNREKVIVIRENGEQREIGELNLKSRKIFESPYYYLQQNDVVYVEPTDARARATSPFAMNLPAIASLGSFASALAMVVFYIFTITKPGA